mmetsp:Transcript_58117/g.142567  ORF Transcript_58117/g.142567 Transcript_58117/m.142567 type:complete len:300 (+) Transcript_58117:131-1030(+)
MTVRMALALLLLALAFLAAAMGETISGAIYCDNQFEFWFNGAKVASDPLAFTPHNAVKVSFEWDGSYPASFSISCQDFATDSGYEYTETSNPQLGDGALLASFTRSDGSVWVQTDRSWRTFVSKSGPTSASVAAGCSGSALEKCVVEDIGDPTDWYASSFSTSSWPVATSYTAAEAGWGMRPTWTGGQCCTVTSPLSRAEMGCSVNALTGAAITVTEDECQDPRTLLESSGATFLWSSDLKTDNRVLFRLDLSSGSGTPSGSPSSTPTSSGAEGTAAARPFALCVLVAVFSALYGRNAV